MLNYSSPFISTELLSDPKWHLRKKQWWNNLGRGLLWLGGGHATIQGRALGPSHPAHSSTPCKKHLTWSIAQKICASSCWKRRTRVRPVRAPESSFRCSTPKSARRRGSSLQERGRWSNIRLQWYKWTDGAQTAHHGVKVPMKWLDRCDSVSWRIS